MAQDDEYAEANREALESAKPSKPAVTEFGMTQELLAQLLDSVRALNANFIQSRQAKKVPPPKPTSRPETAYDRARERWRMQDMAHILERATPKRD